MAFTLFFIFHTSSRDRDCDQKEGFCHTLHYIVISTRLYFLVASILLSSFSSLFFFSNPLLHPHQILWLLRFPYRHMAPSFPFWQSTNCLLLLRIWSIPRPDPYIIPYRSILGNTMTVHVQYVLWNQIFGGVCLYLLLQIMPSSFLLFTNQIDDVKHVIMLTYVLTFYQALQGKGRFSINIVIFMTLLHL